MQIECNVIENGGRLIPTMPDCEEAARRAEEAYRTMCREMNWPRMKHFDQASARYLIEAYLAIQVARAEPIHDFK